jgi:hypothetical protein
MTRGEFSQLLFAACTPWKPGGWVRVVKGGMRGLCTASGPRVIGGRALLL